MPDAPQPRPRDCRPGLHVEPRLGLRRLRPGPADLPRRSRRASGRDARGRADVALHRRRPDGENFIERGFRAGVRDGPTGPPCTSSVVLGDPDEVGGLGSSAAALVAGLRLGALVSAVATHRQELLDAATGARGAPRQRVRVAARRVHRRAPPRPTGTCCRAALAWPDAWRRRRGHAAVALATKDARAARAARPGAARRCRRQPAARGPARPRRARRRSRRDARGAARSAAPALPRAARARASTARSPSTRPRPARHVPQRRRAVDRRHRRQTRARHGCERRSNALPRPRASPAAVAR